MKHPIELALIAAVLALTLSPLARAQTTSESAAGCTEAVKGALYTKFLANRPGKTAENPSGDQEVAYNTAREYKTVCSTDESAQAKYMDKWRASYEVGSRKSQFLLAYDKKNYAEMMRLGNQVLADDPNYVRGYVLLGIIGYLASVAGNDSLNAESMTHAKKALELLEAGKTPDDWKPYSGKDDALAWLTYSIAHTLKTSPTEALPYLLKAARYESIFKKTPLTYINIEQAYETGAYAKQSEDYKQYADKPETPEQKLALQNIYQTVDRMIDAYARAIALAGSDAKLLQEKALWMRNLTEWYKFRNNNSDTGMNEFVTGVLQRPLPDIPTPLTSLPASPATGVTPPAVPPVVGTPAAPGAVSTPPTPPVNTTAPTAKTTAAKTTPAPRSKPKPKPQPRRRRRP